MKKYNVLKCFAREIRDKQTNYIRKIILMSKSRRERREAERQQKKAGNTMKQFIDLKQQQADLEKQFADTFIEYGLEPYGKDSEQFQAALITHKTK